MNVKKKLDYGSERVCHRQGLVFCFLLVAASAFIMGCPSSKKETPAAAADSTASSSSPLSSPSSVTPRNETLFVSGIQYGPPANFNRLSGNPAFPSNQMMLVYERLFMYNQLTGVSEPLLGKSYEWHDQYTLHITLNEKAHWNDGKKFTADDVVYTYKLSQKYKVSWSDIWQFFEDVVAIDPYTVAIKLKKDKYNRLIALKSLTTVGMMPKHIWEAKEKAAGNNLAELRKDVNTNFVGTGPYKHFYHDSRRITVIRDDNYWGKALFGKLPAPKYITHIIFKSNDASNLAFKNGEVDISQSFIPKVWLMWKDGAPIKTYLKKAPYYVPAGMPTLFFNMNKKGLDVPKVRRAIAMAIDYKKIAEIAVSGYSSDLVPSIDNNTPAEAKYVDRKAIKPYQWKTDVAGANKLLDSIGAKRGKDGIRVLKNGTRLGPFELECPFGWSDWNASLEIVMQSCKAIGVEMRTKFPEFPVFDNDWQTGSFDLALWNPTENLSPSQPWDRAFFMMYSKGVPPQGEVAYYNQGRFRNKRADKLLELIPTVTDLDQLKKLYTELTIIYLKNIPSIPLMYRPWWFHTVNESVWKGFPTEDSPDKIPPQIGMVGAGLRALYQIKAKTED